MDSILRYDELMFMHLATIVPSFIIGTILLFLKKGTPIHRTAGRIYMEYSLANNPAAIF